MKKVFLSLATIAIVASGSLTVTSCGSDDSTPIVNPPVVKGIKLALTTPAADIYAGEPFELSIQDADGTPITGAILAVDGEETTIESADGVFSIQGPEGTITLTAVYDGKTSNEVEVTVQPSRMVSEGEGTFMFGGVSNVIESSAVVFRGLFWKDETKTEVVAIWQVEAASGTKTALLQWSTPTKDVGNGQYEYETPNATNTTGLLAAVYEGQNSVGESDMNVMVDFKATLANNFFEGMYSGSSDDINGNPFSLTFDGKTPLVDGSAKAGAKGAANLVSQAGNIVKPGKLTVVSSKITRM